MVLSFVYSSGGMKNEEIVGCAGDAACAFLAFVLHCFRGYPDAQDNGSLSGSAGKNSILCPHLGYNEADNTLTVELIAPEVFDYADVYALKEGDSIYTNGREVVIESLAWDDWKEILWINDGDVCLIKDLDGDYRTENSNDHVWHVMARLECLVKEHLLLMDYVDETSGGMLELPRIFTAEETIAKAQAEQAADYNQLAINNVYVVFDGEGNLAVIHRFYVPWH